jgi:hypothetical protein
MKIMKIISITILSLFFSFILQGQKQLDIQGNPTSPDTVATIKVNYSGTSNVVGLGVYSAPANHLGVGGFFYGGSQGMRGQSTTGTGVSGLSYEGRGVSGISTHTGVLGFSLDDLGGYHTFNEKGGVVGYSDSNPGVYAQSISNYGVYGKGSLGGVYGFSTNGPGVHGKSNTATGILGQSYLGTGVYGYSTHTGVIGVSLVDTMHAVVFTEKSGVLGYSDDTIGILGISAKANGYGVFGRTHVFKGRSVKGEAFGDNSIGVMGVAQAANSTGIWGEGVTGAFFRGSGGTSIQLGGAQSSYSTTSEPDDAVIRTQKNQVHGDLFLVTNDELAIRLDDDNNSTSHFKVFAGDSTQIFKLDESGNLTITGNYYPSSDFHRKERIVSVDPDQILAKISSLPISEWQFKSEKIRHVGPMAQDFYAAFALGKDETTISTTDADGVALAAIKALATQNSELKKQVRVIRQENELLKSMIADLGQRIDRLLKQ